MKKKIFTTLVAITIIFNSCFLFNASAYEPINSQNITSAGITISPKFSVSDEKVKGKKIPILMYHEVADKTWGIENLFIKPSEFEKQLKYFKENGYETITFEDFDDIGKYKKPAMLTFDDGYVGTYTNMYPILKKYNMKATIFVISNMLYSKKYLNSKQIKEMSDSGLVSIQSHTKTHAELKYAKIGKSLTAELEDSKKTIFNITGKEPFVLAFPNGTYNTKIMPEIKKNYKYSLKKNGGIFQCGDDLYTIKRMAVYRDTSLKSIQSMIK
jgi:peptidoglycan/xylan/chitin deacetylase (PgdA/CDA1 family)